MSGNPAGGGVTKLRYAFHAHHLAAQFCQQCSDVAASRPDLEYLVGLAQAQLLNHARLDLWRQHDLAVTEWNFQVCKREIAIRFGYEFLTLERQQQVQHALVENLPGTNLTFDHVEACLFEVH